MPVRGDGICCWNSVDLGDFIIPDVNVGKKYCVFDKIYSVRKFEDLIPSAIGGMSIDSPKDLLSFFHMEKNRLYNNIKYYDKTGMARDYYLTESSDLDSYENAIDILNTILEEQVVDSNSQISRKKSLLSMIFNS